jgi:uncharacterized protein (TIGR02118 family)
MIKITFLMRKKAGLSFEAFTDYWRNSHVHLIRRHAAKLGIRRYVQSHVIGKDVAAALRGEWDDEEPYDGIAEVWLDDLAAVLGTPGDAELAAVHAELIADENRFMDHRRSALLITEEHVLIS